ncbi:hypothetical protein Sme01_28160 [Sphaerisporangium melleum]|uniref:CBM2 domain-containing protein n=1 Tax=Sphaerisporangium melleum TaxID=321316 RepID=A0A917QVT9_9ACTN|nr:hypothetical protein [Sphaerisporangium melleum]GGK69955.1 hypothetical protein GCM10007964_11190 [Sphaerisporangium melleum]GII70340.1 hypothetical protein Sme01_28160 [Sphaerisporangium melleum]
MGRGRHTSWRGRGSEPDGADGRGRAGRPDDDQRGTAEWLNAPDPSWPAEPSPTGPSTGDVAPAHASAANGPSPSGPYASVGEETQSWELPQEPEPPRPSAWDTAPALPWPSSWSDVAPDPASGSASAEAGFGAVPGSGPESGPREADFGSGARPGHTDPATAEDTVRVGLGAPDQDAEAGGDGPWASSADSGDDGADGRSRGRRRAAKPRAGRGRRIAALSAAAVVTAVATVVIGLRLSSGQMNLVETPDCPSGQVCAAVGPAKPPVEDPSTTPSDSGTADTFGDDADEETATPTATPRDPAPSGTPSSRASRTPARPTTRPSTRPTPKNTETAPEDELTSPTTRPTSDETSDPVPTEEETEITTPEATPTASGPDPLIAPGRVSVEFDLPETTSAGYTGRLTITNTGATLGGWTLRVPVSGTVTGADGAEWTQEDGVLVVSSAGRLREGEQIAVSFTAEGEPVLPDTCELTGGRCRLSADAVPPAQATP